MYIFLTVCKQMTVSVTLRYLKPFNSVPKKDWYLIELLVLERNFIVKQYPHTVGFVGLAICVVEPVLNSHTRSCGHFTGLFFKK